EAVRARAEAARLRAEAVQHAGYDRADIERMVARAMAQAPQVEESVSRDGRVQTIRIVQRTGKGGASVTHEMVIDSRCPVDGAKSPAGAGRTVICTGEPRHTARITLQALQGARASLAAQSGLSDEARRAALADVDREIEHARQSITRD
ncbi:antirepressor regulating drug resistance protein, partial [Novosphingobium sp. 1949]|nr:antirepressor regulating drug resistance protein [Novosphingobium organovorum]